MKTNTRTHHVEWGECDPAGIIFNARYFEIFNAATVALFERALGMNKRKMLETYNSAGMPLVQTNVRFMKPVRFGDDITIESTIKFGRSSFQVEHRVSLGNELCAEATEVRVWTVRDANGAIKANPIPAAALKRFSPDSEADNTSCPACYAERTSV
jgi:4-hydroxybenzoyl-CoA thioesterase